MYPALFCSFVRFFVRSFVCTPNLSIPLKSSDATPIVKSRSLPTMKSRNDAALMPSCCRRYCCFCCWVDITYSVELKFCRFWSDRLYIFGRCRKFARYVADLSKHRWFAFSFSIQLKKTKMKTEWFYRDFFSDKVQTRHILLLRMDQSEPNLTISNNIKGDHSKLQSRKYPCQSDQLNKVNQSIVPQLLVRT